MQSEHPAVGLPASVLADAVRRRSFSGSVRGFDRNEVRDYLAQLGAELEEIGRRQEQLESDLREARGRASNPVLDEATITAALGQEAARILQSAHEAAADVRRRAEENAANVLREAHESAQQLNAESETLLAARTAEAESVAAGITQAASSEAEATIARARAEAEAAVADATARAEAMLADADARCRSMVANAERSRDQVLSELMRRRRVVYAQVEQLGAGRDSLLAAVASVKALIGDTEAALESAEADAKAAADAALHRSMTGPQPSVEDVLADVDAPDDEAEPPAGRGDSGNEEADGAVEEGRLQPSAQAAPEALAEEVPEVPDEPVAVPSTDDVVEDRSEPASAPPEAERAVAPANAGARRSPRRTPAVPAPAVSREPLPDHVEEGVRIIGPVSAAKTASAAPREPAASVADGGSASSTTAEPTPSVAAAPMAKQAGAGERPSAKRPRKAAPAQVDAGEAPEAEQVSRVEPTSQVEEGHQVEQTPARAGEPAAVDALFARLKADRVEATKRAEQVLADASVGGEHGAVTDGGGEDVTTKTATRRTRKARTVDAVDTAPEVAEVEDRPTAEAAPGEDGEDAALARRASLLDPVCDKLTRRLKRTLQDDQNDVLDRMRAGARTAETLLAPSEIHAARYSEVAASHLAEALSAGANYAATEFEIAASTPPDDDGEAAGRLAEEIVGPLRRRIEEAVTAAASDEASLADAVGAAYRSLKGERISQLAVDHATGAFAQGVLASLPPGTPVRWVVDDDGPCPDCDDNALAGATPAGEEFPTGQVHPPAHSGCRCLLVSAVS
ncbi:MAG TPA: DivIVA domain-containing protein [Acidimicrobiales bacterium]|nr:DivIVA domain-containing protein [Acidimicrobiales bacterium]